MPKLKTNAKGEHYHRCEWCGVLMECGDTCTQGGPYDPYGKDEIDSDGVLPGGNCDSVCYRRERPRGCQANRTESGGVVR